MNKVLHFITATLPKNISLFASSLNQLPNTAVTLVHQHLNILYWHLDPLVFQQQGKTNRFSNVEKEEIVVRNSKWSFHFLPAAGVLALVTLYGNLVVVYQHYGRVDRWLLQSCPFTMYHGSFPPEMWPYSDMSVLISAAAGIAMYGSFLRNPFSAVSRYHFVTTADHEDPTPTPIGIGGRGKELKC